MSGSDEDRSRSNGILGRVLRSTCELSQVLNGPWEVMTRNCGLREAVSQVPIEVSHGLLRI